MSRLARFLPLAAAALLAACSETVVYVLPEGYQVAGPASGVGPARPGPGAGPVTSPAAAAPPAADPRIPENFVQQGMGVLFFKEDYDRDNLTVEIDNLYDRLQALGVNSVTINWPLYQDSHTATDIRRGDRTPPDEDLRIAFSMAQDRGMWVAFRPYLEESNFFVEAKIWRGTLEPKDRDLWFKDYTQLLLEYAQIAQQAGVDLFSIGVEFNSLDGDPRWRDIIKAVRGVYSGKLTYAANFDHVTAVPFWDELDIVGIDAFYPLDVDPDGLTVEKAIQAWQPWVDQLEEIKRRYQKAVVFMEVGVTSQRDALRKPWAWDTGSPIDMEVQRIYYEATCRKVKPVIAGMYWWVAPLKPLQDPSRDKGHTPLGKPAEQEIKKCFMGDQEGIGGFRNGGATG